MDWQSFKHDFKGIFDFKDDRALTVIMGTIIANKLALKLQRGDPLWLLLGGSSGGGKTELLRIFRGHDDFYFSNRFVSEKALVSHLWFEDKEGKKRKNYSLLPKIDGKVLVIKDLSDWLTMRADRRDAVLSSFRNAYDGFSDDVSGRGDTHISSRFGLIGAGIPGDKLKVISQQLGERYLFLTQRIPTKQRAVIARRSIDDTLDVGKENVRERLREMAWEFLDGLTIDEVEAPENERRELAEWADWLAYCRSAVSRDYYHEVLDEPCIEIGGRVSTQLIQLFCGLKLLAGTDEAWRGIKRVIQDSIPVTRGKILRKLYEDGNVTTSSNFDSRLPYSTVKRAIDDLEILGVLRKEARIGQGGLESYVLGYEMSCDAEKCLKAIFGEESTEQWHGPKVITRKARRDSESQTEQTMWVSGEKEDGEIDFS